MVIYYQNVFVKYLTLCWLLEHCGEGNCPVDDRLDSLLDCKFINITWCKYMNLSGKFCVYFIVLTYLWNYFFIQYHTCHWLSECCEDKAPDDDAVGVFLVVLEGVYKIHISSKLTKAFCLLHCINISLKLLYGWISHLLLIVWVLWRWPSSMTWCMWTSR